MRKTEISQQRAKLLLTCLARFPNTNSIASITLLFPLPLGPTTAEKLWFQTSMKNQIKKKNTKIMSWDLKFKIIRKKIKNSSREHWMSKDGRKKAKSKTLTPCGKGQRAVRRRRTWSSSWPSPWWRASGLWISPGPTRKLPPWTRPDSPSRLSPESSLNDSNRWFTGTRFIQKIRALKR